MKALKLDNEDIRRLAVIHFSGFGSRSLKKIKTRFGDIGEAWQASKKELLESDIQEEKVEAFFGWKKSFDVEAAIQRLADEKISPVFIDDDEYPVSLREISDPPEVLFVKGTIPSSPAVALVGSRKHTHYGRTVVEKIVPPLAAQGLVLVSGLALGIDGLVHVSTLRSQGATVAVLGAGVDTESIYPRAHVRLAEEIVASDGAVISEFPPGTLARKEYFPLRNRIIAGMSLATVVVEAGKKSGSLITARIALDENREVLAVPGSIWSRASSGCHQLLESGAKPCLGAESVLDAIALDRPALIAEARQALPLAPLERGILSALSEPTHIDDLIRKHGLGPSEASSALSLLELKGYVKNTGGQCWIASVRLRSAEA